MPPVFLPKFSPRPRSAQPAPAQLDIHIDPEKAAGMVPLGPGTLIINPTIYTLLYSLFIVYLLDISIPIPYWINPQKQPHFPIFSFWKRFCRILSGRPPIPECKGPWSQETEGTGKCPWNRGVSDVSPRVVQQIAENLRQVYGVTMPPQNHQTRDMDEVGDEKGIPGSPSLGKHNDGRML